MDADNADSSLSPSASICVYLRFGVPLRLLRLPGLQEPGANRLRGEPDKHDHGGGGHGLMG